MSPRVKQLDWEMISVRWSKRTFILSIYMTRAGTNETPSICVVRKFGLKISYPISAALFIFEREYIGQNRMMK